MTLEVRHRGRVQEMDLLEAVEKDEPEGTVTVTLSAKALLSILEHVDGVTLSPLYRRRGKA